MLHKQPCKHPNPPPQQHHWQNPTILKQRQRQKPAQGQGLKATPPFLELWQPAHVVYWANTKTFIALTSLRRRTLKVSRRKGLGLRRETWGAEHPLHCSPNLSLSSGDSHQSAGWTRAASCPLASPAPRPPFRYPASPYFKGPRGAFFFLKREGASLEQQGKGGREAVCKVATQGRTHLLWGTSDGGTGEVEQGAGAS